MRRKEGKEEGHFFFLLLLHSKFSKNYGIKQQPFYYAYNCVGQEFERDPRGISSSLGHDIWNLPRQTQSLEVTLWLGCGIVWRFTHLLVWQSVLTFSETLGWLRTSTSILGLIMWLLGLPHSIVPGFQDQVLHSNQVEAMLPFMAKPWKSPSWWSQACPHSRGGNLSPSIRGESVRVILRVIRQILLQPVLENTIEDSIEMIKSSHPSCI